MGLGASSPPQVEWLLPVALARPSRRPSVSAFGVRDTQMGSLDRRLLGPDLSPGLTGWAAAVGRKRLSPVPRFGTREFAL